MPGRKTIQYPALAIGLLLLAGCQNPANPSASGQLSASEQQELRQASGEWDRLFNAGDAAKLAALYADDAVSMPPNSATVQGRKAIQAEFENFFAGNTARHETVVDRIYKDGDLAIEVAHYRLISKPRAGGAETVETGRHVECRRKIGGEWKIVVEIWNSETPATK